MGKSLGTKFSGKGPGLQKKTKLQRKYLTDPKAQVKKGSMAELDFGVEKAPKVSKEQAATGLKGDTSVVVPPASKAAKTSAAAGKAKSEPASGTKKAVAAAAAAAEATAAAVAASEPREWQAYAPEGKGERKCLAEKVGAEHYARAVNNQDEYQSARDFAMQKTLEKKRKKCAPC
eukprot:Tamp_32737.p1 GENE.Tamp_32737~~Tamp_32737.p1  ORF type:complete len:184 (+),score=64.89 Tamp_32737:29-553(+)